LERAMVRLESLKPEDMKPSDESRAIASYLLAGCFDRLGDTPKAIRHLNEAIDFDPDNASILESRGILRYGVESGALDDFKRAAELGPQDAWPDFYLAHHALVAGRYDECLRYCERGLRFHAPGEVRSLLYEWLAISRVESRYPPDQVRSAFEEAIRLAPDTDRIRDNFAKFEGSLTDSGGPRPDWIKPKASTVQAFGRSDFRPPRPSSPLAA
jgi:tetratricopeptide (TPR) repeat protein